MWLGSSCSVTSDIKYQKMANKLRWLNATGALGILVLSWYPAGQTADKKLIWHKWSTFSVLT